MNQPYFKEIEGVKYTHDYNALIEHCVQLSKEGNDKKRKEIYRSFCRKDLFFLMYFVLGVKVVNCKYGYEFVKEVENNNNDRTLWLCAREHLKSITITTAKTIQNILNNPESTTLILSYKSAIAVDFVKAVKTTLETNQTLNACYPDILHQDVNKAREWTQEKFTVQRKGTQKESTVCAGGLLQGMPTGVHYEGIIYDDIMTHDLAISMRKNTDVIHEIRDKFDMSLNLGTSNPPVHIDVVGTPYFHEDILQYIKDKGNYEVVMKPATDTGKRDGKPVFLTQEKLDELKKNPFTFNSQQLLDPTPTDQLALNPAYLKYVDSKLVPHNVFRFMIVDPAATAKTTSDSWAMSVWGVEPNLQDIGFSKVYLLDCFVGVIDRQKAYKLAANMFVRNSNRMMMLAVEEVATGSDSIHIANAVTALGFPCGQEYMNLRTVNPGGKNKEDAIVSACQAPLANFVVHISSAIPEDTRQIITTQMKSFPWSGEDDWLDTWRYLYKVIEEFDFISNVELHDTATASQQAELIEQYMGGVA